MFILNDTLKIMEAKNKTKPKYKVGDKIEYIDNTGHIERFYIIKRTFDKVRGEWYYYTEYRSFVLGCPNFKGIYESKIIRKVES